MQSDELIAGRYRKLRLLGRGGFAEVYLAEDVRLGNRRVALKLLARHILHDKERLHKFRQEAEIIGHLTSQNTVRAYDYGSDENDNYYIAMEYIQGETLHEILRRERRLSEQRVLLFGIQILDALEEAHDLNIIHRDLKPKNIMVIPQRQGELIKILDFGVARIIKKEEEDEDAEWTMVGTATYMAPEQAQGKPISAASDLYSLGVILYHCICGRPPFTSKEDPVAIMIHHATKPVVSMREARPELGISAETDEAILRVLEKDPTQRYASAADFRMALERAFRSLHEEDDDDEEDTIHATVVDFVELPPETPPVEPTTDPEAAAHRPQSISEGQLPLTTPSSVPTMPRNLAHPSHLPPPKPLPHPSNLPPPKPISATNAQKPITLQDTPTPLGDEEEEGTIRQYVGADSSGASAEDGKETPALAKQDDLETSYDWEDRAFGDLEDEDDGPKATVNLRFDRHPSQKNEATAVVDQSSPIKDTYSYVPERETGGGQPKPAPTIDDADDDESTARGLPQPLPKSLPEPVFNKGELDGTLKDGELFAPVIQPNLEPVPSPPTKSLHASTTVAMPPSVDATNTQPATPAMSPSGLIPISSPPANHVFTGSAEVFSPMNTHLSPENQSRTPAMFPHRAPNATQENLLPASTPSVNTPPGLKGAGLDVDEAFDSVDYRPDAYGTSARLQWLGILVGGVFVVGMIVLLSSGNGRSQAALEEKLRQTAYRNAMSRSRDALGKKEYSKAYMYLKEAEIHRPKDPKVSALKEQIQQNLQREKLRRVVVAARRQFVMGKVLPAYETLRKLKTSEVSVLKEKDALLLEMKPGLIRTLLQSVLQSARGRQWALGKRYCLYLTELKADKSRKARILCRRIQRRRR
tara:strand:+ start:8042 stop:10651 length:2610 start_codon:yes stop_codon:yes gene_type:complete